MRRKAVVIGLDGATFDIIDPLIEAGHLPNLERLIKGGCRGRLESTIIPNSFPGWTSCSTGIGEGNHGIFSPLVRGEDNFSLRPMSAADIRAKTIWEILSERGRRVGVINDPCSYPPAPVNGFLISGMLWPGPPCPYSFPESLQQEIESEVPGYIVDVDLADKSKEEIFSQLRLSIEKRLSAALHFMNSREWDLFWIVFTESDRAQHRFWADMDRMHPVHSREQAERFGNCIFEIYRELDRCLGEIVNACPESAAVFIVSDHGFGPLYSSFDITRWLIDEGFLAQKGEKALLKRILGKIGLLEEATLVYRGLKRFRQAEPKYGPDKLQQQSESIDEIYSDVDWSKTRAYYTLDNCIRLNLKGREPQGIVEPGSEEKALGALLKEKLSTLRFPNGKKVFRAVSLKQEAYCGRAVDLAADLIIPIDYGAYRGPADFAQYVSVESHNTGEHTPDGIFIAWGDGIESGKQIVGAHLRDIASTVLFYLDEPLTEEMEGRALLEAFSDSFKSNRRIRRSGTSFKDNLPKGADSGDREKIEEKLRELGYI